MKKKFTYEEIQAVTLATYKIFDVAKSSDDPNEFTAEIQFINAFIETLVTRILNDKSSINRPREEQYRTLKANFLRLKVCVQEATALAFQEPMRKFTKIDMEYCCTIKPVPMSGNVTSH